MVAILYPWVQYQMLKKLSWKNYCNKYYLNLLQNRTVQTMESIESKIKKVFPEGNGTEIAEHLCNGLISGCLWFSWISELYFFSIAPRGQGGITFEEFAKII